MKNFTLDILSGIPAVNRFYSGIGTIFMLHRVCPSEPGKFKPNDGMRVSPEFLERFITEARSKQYDFIGIDRLVEILENGEEAKKQIVLTVDDGYRDIYEIACPIFRKHNVPFTVYVTTSFPERTALLWWYALEDLIARNDEIFLGDGRIFSCGTENDKINSFIKIREIIIRLGGGRGFKNGLGEIFKNYQIDWRGKCDELALDWGHIKELSKNPLATIGSHTKNHYVLKTLAYEEALEEMSGGNEILELKTGKKVNHFSFPFGGRDAVGGREIEITGKTGIKTALTTLRGNIHREHSSLLRSLPRVPLTENFKIEWIGRPKRKKIPIV